MKRQVSPQYGPTMDLVYPCCIIICQMHGKLVLKLHHIFAFIAALYTCLLCTTRLPCSTPQTSFLHVVLSIYPIHGLLHSLTPPTLDIILLPKHPSSILPNSPALLTTKRSWIQILGQADAKCVSPSNLMPVVVRGGA